MTEMGHKTRDSRLTTKAASETCSQRKSKLCEVVCSKPSLTDKGYTEKPVDPRVCKTPLLLENEGSPRKQNLQSLTYLDDICSAKYKTAEVKTELLKGRNVEEGSCENDLEDFSALLRAVTWLSPSELPVPQITLTLLYAGFEPLINILDQIADGNSPPPQVTMRYELLRICTFRTYPHGNKPYLTRFAKAGFYYASDQDGVVCYCCGIRRYGWSVNEDPVAVHKRINGSCKFFARNDEFNVPAVSELPLRQKVAALDQIPESNSTVLREDDNNNESTSPSGEL